MALTETQKKWAVGGTIAAVALGIGYGLFHSGPVQAAVLPPGYAGPLPSGGQGRRPHARGGHGHHKKSHRDAAHEGYFQENGRGEYGRKKHRRRGHH